MRKSVTDLVEAVRALRLSSITRDDVRHVRMGLDPSEMHDALLAVHDALDAFDADTGKGNDDSARLSAALDETFRWLKTQGLPIDEPLARVAEIMGMKSKRRSAAYDILPSFSPKHARKKGWKPRLALPIGQLGNFKSISDHRKVAADMEQVVLRAGAIVPPQEEYDLGFSPKR